ncbi:MAG: HD-GYP domain-containing protein [Oligoflexales bacterium]
MADNFFYPKKFSRDDLISISINLILPDSITDFDLYISVAGHFVLYAPPPYQWAGDELTRLGTDGHAELFYNNVDAKKAKAYLQISRVSKIDESLEPDKRINHIMDISAEITKVLYDHEFSFAAFKKLQEISDSLIKCIRDDISCVKALGLLEHHDQYTFYHSGRVCAYGVALAIKMFNPSKTILDDLALGCLLHDVGKSRISLDVINKPGKLTAQEWMQMKKHPKWGVDLMSNVDLNHVTKEIILHHHERLDGGGYPDGLAGHELLEEVKIAAFADIFDALTTNKPHSTSKTKYEALDFIKFTMLDLVSKDVYKAMVELLAIQKKR